MDKEYHIKSETSNLDKELFEHLPLHDILLERKKQGKCLFLGSQGPCTRNYNCVIIDKMYNTDEEKALKRLRMNYLNDAARNIHR